MPSFVTNDETLCILDRYVPEADKQSPGRRVANLKEGFWSDFPDMKSAYLRQKLRSLPREMFGVHCTDITYLAHRILM